MKRAFRAPRKFSANGAVRKNDATKGSASAPTFKHPKTELEAATQRYADLFEFAPIAYVSFDRVGRIEEINLAAVQLLGGSQARLIGEPFALYVTKDDGLLFLNHLLRCRSSDSRVETELHLKKRNGDIILARLESSPMTSSMREGARFYQTAIVDITERRRTEQQLAEQARLLDLSNDAILVCDRQGRITYWNHGAKGLYGYTAEEALGKVAYELLRTTFPEPLPVIRKKLYRDNRWRGELVHTCKDGRRVVVISRWALDRDAKGAPASVLETNTEITERKRTEERTAVNLAVTRILSESPALTDAATKILQAVCGALEWKVGIFWAPEPDGNVLRCLNVCESAASKLPRFKAASMKLRLAAGIGLPGRVWKTLKTAWVADVTKDHNFPRATVAAEEGLHGSVAFPIFFGKHFLGVMEFFSPEIREPDEDLLKMLGSIGSQIGQFMQRKHAEAELRKSKELLETMVEQRTRALQTANIELKEEIARRRGLEGEILKVTDREQQRLGRELHDGLCQQLAAIGLMTRTAALRLKNHRVVDAEELEKIAQLINNSSIDAHQISRDLHKEQIDAAHFERALHDLTERKIWSTPCRLCLETRFEIENDKVASELYRILREAITNANKHASATEIIVKVQRDKRDLVFTVEDNGVGLNGTPSRNEGLGFHIMKYRAEMIGAGVKMESPRNGGTCVTIRLSKAALSR